MKGVKPVCRKYVEKRQRLTLLLELTEVRVLAVMMILGFMDTDVLRVRFTGQGQRERSGEPERAQSEPRQ